MLDPSGKPENALPARKAHPIDAAISTLCEPDVVPSPQAAMALARLVNWMRLPGVDEPFLQKMSNVSLLRCLAGWIDQPKCEEALVQLASQSQFLFLFDEDVLREVALYSSNDEELRYLSQVVRFVVTFKSDGDSKRQKASLSKAFFGLQNGIYGRKWDNSLSIHDQIWRYNKANCAFITAELLDYRRLLALRCEDQQFADSCSSIISDRTRLQIYFGTVRWLQECLQAELDPAALRGVRFPRIPEWIEAVPLKTADTDAKQRAIMRRYKSSGW